MYPAGDKIVSGTLWSAFDKHRCLYFQKTVLVEIIPSYLGNFVAKHQVFLHIRPSKIKIPVFQPCGLIHARVLFYMKRRSLGTAQYPQFRGQYLDPACLHRRVDSFRRSWCHLSLNCDHIFVSYGLSLIEYFPVCLVAKNYLQQPRPVSQIYKQQTAQISPFMDPAHHSHFFPHIRLTQFGAHVGPLHTIDRLSHKPSPILNHKTCCLSSGRSITLFNLILQPVNDRIQTDILLVTCPHILQHAFAGFDLIVTDHDGI